MSMTDDRIAQLQLPDPVDDEETGEDQGAQEKSEPPE